MKKDNLEDNGELKIIPRPSEAVTIQLPTTVLLDLARVAEARNMSVHALIRAYIGQSLRMDYASLFPENVRESTQEILRHSKTVVEKATR